MSETHTRKFKLGQSCAI